ncbi:ribosomal protein S18-alanine N-acetyltransferase [Okibacterium fritillariae]|uniref:ribosomal protein S18-alanine N-acetyltransferase n=1 Tax=Okibacterium fritillariae TaxID=123320 RepID=UPI0040554527
MTWQLRRATLDDVAAIMAIETSVFETDAWSDEMMRADVASPHTYYVVAFHPETPDAIDGYAGFLAPAGSRDGDVQTIAVAEHARRRGLGRVLMGALLGEARRRRVSEVFLEVREDNPVAQGLYDSLGFVPIAVRPHYYQPDDVAAVVMKLTVPEPQPGLAVGHEITATEAPA